MLKFIRGFIKYAFDDMIEVTIVIIVSLLGKVGLLDSWIVLYIILVLLTKLLWRL